MAVKTGISDINSAYAEYRQLRYNVALKRLNRLEKAGFTSSDVYREFAWVKNMPAGKIAPSDIDQALSDLKRFLYQKPSTIKGLRESYKSASEALKERGYDIKPKDVPHFRRFMEQVTSRTKARIESASAADVYSEMASKGLLDNEKNRREVMRNFEFYKRNLDAVEREVESTRGKRGGVSLTDIRKKLGR